MNRSLKPWLVAVVLLFAGLACNLPGGGSTPVADITPTAESTDEADSEEDASDDQTPTGDTADPTPTSTTAPSGDGGGSSDGDTNETTCGYDAAFLRDVTIPDGTEFDAGAGFDKTWELENSGCADWPAGTELVYVRGDQMNGPGSVAVAATPAGQSQTVTVSLTAPNTPGDYRGYWQLRAEGDLFGPQIYADIVVVGAGSGNNNGEPDVAVTSITGYMVDIHNHSDVYYQDQLVVNDPIAFDVVITNNGDAPAEDINITFAFFGSTYEEQAFIAELAPGASQTLTFTAGESDPGSHDVIATAYPCADPDCREVDDANEADNEREESVTVFTPFVYVDSGIGVSSIDSPYCIDFDSVEADQNGSCPEDLEITEVDGDTVTASLVNFRITKGFGPKPTYEDCSGLGEGAYVTGGTIELNALEYYCGITTDGRYVIFNFEAFTIAGRGDVAAFGYETYDVTTN